MKHIKLIILVITVIIFASCGKIKTYNLIGTYKSEDLYMILDTRGFANITKIDPSKTLNGLAQTMGGFGTFLIPWELSSEKTSYTFEGTEKRGETSGGATIYYNVYYKIVFTQNKENINCQVTLTVPEGKGESGTINFNK